MTQCARTLKCPVRWPVIRKDEEGSREAVVRFTAMLEVTSTWRL